MTPEERLRNMMAGARGEDPVTESQWEGFAVTARRSVRVRRMVAGAAAVAIVVAGGLGAAALFGDFGGGPDKVPPAETPSACQDIDAPDNPAACNYEPEPSRVPTPNTSPTSLPTDVDVKPPPERMGEIWLVDPKTDTLSFGYRIMPGGGDSADMLSVVIDELLRSPITSDMEAGFETEIPPGTELLDAEIDDGTARIDLSFEFLERDEIDKAKSLLLREAQVVFMGTQIERVESVVIEVEGDPFAGSNDILPTERGMAAYDDVAPPIVVETPRIGEEVTSPLTVAGTANVFEATVSIELVIGDGKNAETIETFATATCGSGCRGDFSKKIAFDVDEPADATLNVYESSAEDGSRLHEISLPITLVPSD